MAKGRGSKSTKLQAAREQPKATSSSPEKPEPEKPDIKGKSKQVSEELRQAVKDLGGDDDDLDLIAGIDSDEEQDAAPSTKGKKSSDGDVDEGLKKALRAFMKGLDFKSVAPGGQGAAPDSEEDDEEDVSEGESSGEGEDEDEDEDEDEEEDEDESDDDEEEESEEEIPEPAPKKTEPVPSVKKAKAVEETKVKVQEVKVDTGSAKDVPPTPVWTSLMPELAPSTQPLEPIQTFKLQGLRSKANNLLENLNPLSRAGSSSDAAFITQILQSGTHQDKLSALVLLVRESPIHAVKELNRLRGMMGFKEDGTIGGGGNKDQKVAVIKALADWWTTGGGKDSGKLRYFADQPLLAHPDLTDRHLLVFAFEDYLKKWFFNLLQVLETLSHDTLPYVRIQALHVAFQLLRGNAEQEQNLLRLGVNKLGDNDKSVASKTSHQILQTLQEHPAMKAVIAREISALVLKPVAAASATPSSGTHVRFDDGPKKADKEAEKTDTLNHGRYYGLITLNQITLTSKDQEVAGRMVELYFEVFREVLGEGAKAKEEVTIGEDGEEVVQEQVEKVAGKVDKWRGRRKGSKPRGGRMAAAQGEQLVETTEARLIAAVLSGINRALPYARLEDELFTKYMDTLFKITHAGTFNTSIQALSLIQQICQTRATISDRFYRTLYDSLMDERLITSSKQAMYLNMLFKALKADTSLPRVMAFVKRLLQMLGLHQPPFICGALYLLGELFSATPGLKRMLIEPEDDGDEHFVDAPEDGAPAASSSKAPPAVSFDRVYDGKKREPLYAHADSSCLWDLLPFLNHFHPSVSLQANQLLLSQPLTGSSDISLNTLVSFLDRFVYRNPKKTLQPKGASIMQPAAASDVSGMVFNKKGARSAESNYVNSESFWRKKIADVPVDQLFFHKFFSTKLAQKDAAKKKGGKGKDEDDDEMLASDSDADMSGEELPASVADEEDEDDEEDDDEDEEEADDDEEEVGSDPEEAAIWKAMKASMPDAGDDLGLSEADESDESLDYDDEEIEADDDEDADEDEEASAESPEPEVQSKKSKGKGKRQASPEDEPEDEDEEDDDDDDFGLVSDSDDEDLIPLEEMPDIRLDGAVSAEEEDEDEIEAGKRKRREERKDRRKKRKQMPVFASADDYRSMIDNAPSDDD